jgi:hypothetical protein
MFDTLERKSTMLDDLPPFLTVPQAAKVLQLGRSKMYELTAEYDCTGGRSGVAFIWLGHQKRIPRSVLLRLLEPGQERPPGT